MSPDPQALATLLDHATVLRDEALTAARQAEAQAERQLRQAEQLQAYRGEYEQRWQSQFRQGGSMQIVQCYRDFMARLEQALATQRRQAEQAQMMCRHARDALLEAERRVASVKKLIERREAEARRVVDRREQKASDEMAARHARNLPSAFGLLGRAG